MRLIKTIALLTGLGVAVLAGGQAEAARGGSSSRGTQVTRTAKAPGPAVRAARASAAPASRREVRAVAAPRAFRAVVPRVAARGADRGRAFAAAPLRGRAFTAAPSRGRIVAAAPLRGRMVVARAGSRQAKALPGTRHANRVLDRAEMRQMASAACLRRDSRGRCTGPRLAGFISSAQAAPAPARSWHAGLPASDGEQMACPEGTMATLARGHSDTIRCMPL
ncbi:hypothetical protein [Roseomonas sp. BN140053]|uniref:hypothetical protein n=1 Tax=Roseomonas sp. BN140053 TaxID=3391898 RepID=UPI0039EBA375